MKIKIISCTDSGFWYAGKIGKEFYVTELLAIKSFYFVEGSMNAIQKTDCEVIHE